MNIEKISSDEYLVTYNGDHWYSNSKGEGSIPEKYWDTSIESEAIRKINAIK